MKWDNEEALFSVKCFAAAMLACYVALRVGLPRPYWAVITTYLVAQSLAGAVVSRALFRLVGTAVGAAIAVILVPNFVREPLVLSAMLSSWLGACLFLALLDRTPRAYLFILAGFTASLIGFPAFDEPGSIFEIAVVRVEEITIGIVASSIIHGLVFPRTVTRRVLVQAKALLTRSEQRTREALSVAPASGDKSDRLRLAADLAELDQLAVQLPFDTARMLPRTRTLRAFQDRLLELLPLAAAVEDRLGELCTTGGVPDEIADAIREVDAWLVAQGAGQALTPGAAALSARLRRIAASAGAETWRALLSMNLCTRLADLVEMHADARDLADQLRAPDTRPLSRRTAELLYRESGRALHRDPTLAFRSALGAAVAMFLACLIWTATAWRDGSGAIVMVSVCCALFTNVDRPAPVISRFFGGAMVGVAVAAIYTFWIFPEVTTFATRVVSLAPPLLLAGALIARPTLTVPALGASVAFLTTANFNATAGTDMAFANSPQALLAGIGFAAVSTRLLQTVDRGESIGRLFRAGWRDVAHRARGVDLNEREWASRMLDRVGLMLPRIKGPASAQGAPMDALTNMRIGLIAGRLRQLSERSPAFERVAAEAALDGIAQHFEQLDPARPVAPPVTLLDRIDHSIRAYARDANVICSREALVHLTSLRRDLFPAAAAAALEVAKGGGGPG